MAESTIKGPRVAGGVNLWNGSPVPEVHAGTEITLSETAINYNFLMMIFYAPSVAAANQIRFFCIPAAMGAEAWYPLAYGSGVGAVKMKVVGDKVTITDSTFSALYFQTVNGYI